MSFAIRTRARTLNIEGSSPLTLNINKPINSWLQINSTLIILNMLFTFNHLSASAFWDIIHWQMVLVVFQETDCSVSNFIHDILRNKAFDFLHEFMVEILSL